MLRKVALVFVIVLMSVSAFSQKGFHSDSTHTAQAENSGVVSNLLSFAKNHLRIPYRSGGITPKGFDCSGFVRYCFNNLGILLPHSSSAQGLLGAEIMKSAAMPGDIILFKGHNSKSKRIGHVGIVAEVTDKYIKFIHSACGGGVKYDYLDTDYYRKRFVSIKRVIGSMDVLKSKKVKK